MYMCLVRVRHVSPYGPAYTRRHTVCVRTTLHDAVCACGAVPPKGATASLQMRQPMPEIVYTDDVLPYIAVGDAAATLLEAPGENGLAVLRRKQLYSGLEVDVLESQLVVLHGTEKPEERRRREAAGIGPENLLASQLACR